MEKKYTLAEIEMEVDRLAAIIGASKDDLPTYGYSRDFAYPHIEVDSQGYHYVIVERGHELRRITTNDLDILLYHIFEDITAEIGANYSANHRIKDQDFRRLYFQHQIELLNRLSPKWAVIESKEHERILREHPYHDFASLDAKPDYSLRGEGSSGPEAKKITNRKYPESKP